MIEIYILIGLILATGALLVCDKTDKKMYVIIFFMIMLLWPVIGITALLK